jgi:hypothetical protein
MDSWGSRIRAAATPCYFPAWRASLIWVTVA